MIEVISKVLVSRMQLQRVCQIFYVGFDAGAFLLSSPPALTEKKKAVKKRKTRVRERKNTIVTSDPFLTLIFAVVLEHLQRVMSLPDKTDY